jgi:NodT family efflux transporter outer membrane factor (OMF) lipoprotein
MRALLLPESLDGAERGGRESLGRRSSRRQPTASRGAWLERSGVKVVLFVAALGLLSACTVGPDYVRPTVEAPAAYKELNGWKVAQPRDDFNRGPWWERFGDPQLSALEAQVDISNQNLVVAEAQFRQARALVQAARAGYFPTITAGAAATRSRRSSTLGSGSSTSSTGALTDYLLSLDASWELDVWGRVRRTVESNEASVQASAADLAATRLSAQAELAQDYFELRALDAQQQLLEATVAAYAKSLQLTQNRYASGVAAKAEVVLAETQLKTTQAQAIDIGVQRAQLEHAIALLVGKPASTFAISVAPLTTAPPPIPVGVPSALLERRPDIAAAERLIAAANAQIGVAEAAFFPTLTLSASRGFESSDLSRWLTLPSRFWAVGPALAETLFEGGLRQAQTEEARAAYDANVAAYRQTVLTGFQEVENNLAALRILEQEAQVQDAAVQDARQSVTLATNQYKGGIVSYLDVIVVQAIALTNERSAVDILGRRLVASVLLIKALGGGWNAADLPTAADLAGNNLRQPVHEQ